MKKYIPEAKLSTGDIEALFRTISSTNNTKTGLAGHLSNASNKISQVVNKKLNRQPSTPLNYQQLINEWKIWQYPDDSKDIYALLKQANFNVFAIQEAFRKVFGTYAILRDLTDDDTGYTEATEKLAKYIINNGLAADVIKFLETEFKKEFRESVCYEGKIDIDELKELFAEVIKQDSNFRKN